ncbi:MAG TPA: SDR family NAD(P)-dependent oxidoreductase [Cytophaga sp.]|jgi:benzil reductase ((S)-benzoin forming)|nr:SDR family NAD(P)-dependent oxidoreductase [Cytophaga sp.]
MHYYYISGTSSGIGRALAVLLLEREDTQVIGISRTCTIEHSHYTHVQADLSEPDQVTQAIQSFKSGHTTEDSIYLINNAGIIDPIQYAGTYKESDIQRMIQVNLVAPMQLINVFLQIPKETYKNRVVLSVSSGAATKVIDGWSLYGAAKASLDHFSSHIARELELSGENNTRIFSVAPGTVDTAMQQKIREACPDCFSSVERFLELHVTNQLVAPEVIAEKYSRILDKPENFLNTIFSLRDMS